MSTVDNTQDVIDSRDIIERLTELVEPAELDADERREYDALNELAIQGSSSPDWQYGETLIRDSYFVTYARELAEEIGAVPTDGQWPTYCIDWEWAARELQVDYFTVDFDGVTYWVRS